VRTYIQYYLSIDEGENVTKKEKSRKKGKQESKRGKIYATAEN
jgi:hypothetical protein